MPLSLCTLHRLRISSALDDHRTLPASVQRHVGSCPACRHHLAQVRALDTRLELERGEHNATAPAWLRTRVMAEVRATRPTPARSPAAAWGTAAAAVTAAVAVLAIVNRDQGASPETGPTPVAASDAAAAVDTGAVPEAIASVHPAQVPEQFGRGASSTLGREARNLAADIRGARSFLTASFRSTLPGL